MNRPSPAVFIVPHQASWSDAYKSEAGRITRAAMPMNIRLHHIGSTAIPGIFAKPIIDLLGVVSDLHDLDQKTSALEELGYEAKGEMGIPGRRYFRRTNAEGQRSHHLHVFGEGSPAIERHLAFRDFLIVHPGQARAYSELKQRLMAIKNITWDAYIDGKSPFIEKTEQDALVWYRQQQT